MHIKWCGSDAYGKGNLVAREQRWERELFTVNPIFKILPI